MPDLTETSQQKAARWMAAIRPYLQYAAAEGHDPEFLAQARKKNPFLDWVLSNPDLDPVLYFVEIPPVTAPSVPWEIESPGIPKPDTSKTIADVYALLARIARQMGVQV